MDWFQIGKGVHQGCILSPCLFNVHAEYIIQNAGLDESQAGIKIDGRNINSLRYADDTTLMAESEKEVKSVLMSVKEDSEKDGLLKGHGIQSHHFVANKKRGTGNSDRFFFLLGSKIMLTVTSAMKLKDACSLEEKL